MSISFPERFNMSDYFLYRNLEEGRENKTCLYYEDQQFTYQEVAEAANRTGNALRAVGLDIEERVLIVLPIVRSLSQRGLARRASEQLSRWLTRCSPRMITNTILTTRERGLPSFTIRN